VNSSFRAQTTFEEICFPSLNSSPPTFVNFIQGKGAW
jgi:hypothetical protein